MKNNDVLLYEYGLSPAVDLSQKVVQGLNRVIDRFERRNQRILEIRPFEDRYKLITKNFVGVIHSNEKRIQILPKLFRRASAETDFRGKSLRSLHYMLSFAMKLPVEETSESVFKLFRDDFLEIYILMFLVELEGKLRTSMVREYVGSEENLSFPRGKVNITKHISENAVKNNPCRISCEFDEITEDNLMNQTIKYTLRLLRAVSRNHININRIAKLLFTFSDVSDRVVEPGDEERILFNRINEPFRPVIRKCFLFIDGFSIDLSTGATNYGAILFNMDELFEEFVANFIIRYRKRLGLEPLHIEAQKRLNSLDNNGRINLKPDIVFTDGKGTALIVDTKYKLLDKAKRNQNISNSDIYQMLAYGIRSNCLRIVMLYPRPENYGEDDVAPIEIGLHHSKTDELPSKVEIYARTIDVMKEIQKDLREGIIEDLSGIFKEYIVRP